MITFLFTYVRNILLKNKLLKYTKALFLFTYVRNIDLKKLTFKTFQTNIKNINNFFFNIRCFKKALSNFLSF